MKLCRFEDAAKTVHVGLLRGEDTVVDLAPAGVTSISTLLESDDALGELQKLSRKELPEVGLSQVRLLAPIERQEVWAVGVTYLRSKKARMDESDFSATAYDRVYEAARPELFFKALPEKVV